MKSALILSGGGARAAYQVGVLKALAEILPASAHNPFPIICGTSAGALNALALASHAGNFSEAVNDLVDLWADLRVEHIYRSDWWDLVKGFGKLGASLLNEGVGRHSPISLLDNSPLRSHLTQHLDFSNIDRSIRDGDLEAVSVTAVGYTSGRSVSFFQGREGLQDWQRHRRIGISQKLSVDHLLASSAIPTIFPAVKLGEEYFGDGALRQLTPISPALHLGADRVFVVGVSGNRNPEHWGHIRQRPLRHSPSMAQIAGHMFNSAFIDSLEGDIEHLDTINRLLALMPEEQRQAQSLRPVDSLVISPSKELHVIAGRKVRYLPRSLRFLLRSAGATAKGGGSTAASYLLFHESFCNELIDLGYQDTMWEAEGVGQFFAEQVQQ